MSDGHCFILWHNGAKVSIPPVLPILYSSNVEIWISFFPDEKHKVKKRTSKRKVMLLSDYCKNGCFIMTIMKRHSENGKSQLWV